MTLYGVVEETVLNICNRELTPAQFKLVRSYGPQLPEIMDKYGVALAIEDDALANRVFQIVKLLHNNDPAKRLKRKAKAMMKVFESKIQNVPNLSFTTGYYSWIDNMDKEDSIELLPRLNIPLSPKKSNTKPIQSISVAIIYRGDTNLLEGIAWAYCLQTDIDVPQYGQALALMKAWQSSIPYPASQHPKDMPRIHPDEVLGQKITDPEIRKALMLD